MGPGSPLTPCQVFSLGLLSWKSQISHAAGGGQGAAVPNISLGLGLQERVMEEGRLRWRMEKAQLAPLSIWLTQMGGVSFVP